MRPDQAGPCDERPAHLALRCIANDSGCLAMPSPASAASFASDDCPGATSAALPMFVLPGPPPLMPLRAPGVDARESALIGALRVGPSFPLTLCYSRRTSCTDGLSQRPDVRHPAPSWVPEIDALASAGLLPARGRQSSLCACLRIALLPTAAMAWRSAARWGLRVAVGILPRCCGPGLSLACLPRRGPVAMGAVAGPLSGRWWPSRASCWTDRSPAACPVHALLPVLMTLLAAIASMRPVWSDPATAMVVVTAWWRKASLPWLAARMWQGCRPMELGRPRLHGRPSPRTLSPPAPPHAVRLDRLRAPALWRRPAVLAVAGVGHPAARVARRDAPRPPGPRKVHPDGAALCRGHGLAGAWEWRPCRPGGW